MAGTSSWIALLIFASTIALGQETHTPDPCFSRLVNGRVCLNEGTFRGFLMQYVAPKLPEGANENSEVVLHVLVPKTGGKPTEISLVSGDPTLARSAIRAVRNWIFMAYLYNGEPVGMEGDLRVRFKKPT